MHVFHISIIIHEQPYSKTVCIATLNMSVTALELTSGQARSQPSLRGGGQQRVCEGP